MSETYLYKCFLSGPSGLSLRFHVAKLSNASCNAPEHGLRHFQGHRTLLQLSWTLQLRPAELHAFGRRNSYIQGHRTLLQRAKAMQLLRPEPQNAAATLLDAAAAAS